jgi:hypothetical protein
MPAFSSALLQLNTTTITIVWFVANFA